MTEVAVDKYYLNKINEFKIEFDGGIVKKFERKPLSSKNIKEVERIRNNTSSYPSHFDALFASYQLIARHSLGISTQEEFDSAILEDDPELIEKDKVFGLKSVLDACLLRSINGIAYYSPELEEWLMYESQTTLLKLTPEIIDAWNMWINKQHGIMPNQYHYFYDQGDTLIYPEHIADLLTIEKIWNNKMKREQHKAEQKNNKNKAGGGVPSNNKGNEGRGFYGQTFKYNK
jgi:hypothetical protein